MRLPVSSDFDKDGMLPEEAQRHRAKEGRAKLQEIMMRFLFHKAVSDIEKKKKENSKTRKKLVFAFNK